MNQNQQNGIISNGQRRLEIDMRGVCGELAVCKKYNAYPDMMIGPHYSGYDLTVNHKKIDVKTTKYNPAYLQAKLKKKPKDLDAFILVHDASPTFTLLGWMIADNLLMQEYVRNTGYGEMYTMESNELWTMDTFERYAYHT